MGGGGVGSLEIALVFNFFLQRFSASQPGIESAKLCDAESRK